MPPPYTRDPGVEGVLTALAEIRDALVGGAGLPTGAATQVTLAAVLAKVIAAPATEAKQDVTNALLTTQASYLDGVETLLGALGTQTTLAAVLAKLSADPATQATLAAILAAVTAAIPAGANVIGKVGIDQSTTASSTARLLSAVGTSQDATIVKASAGRLYGIQGYNAASSVRYLKLYNKATAPSSADTPVKTLALPPTAAFALDWPLSYSFTTGISFRLTTGGADNDATGVTAADILGLNVDYV